MDSFPVVDVFSYFLRYWISRISWLQVYAISICVGSINPCLFCEKTTLLKEQQLGVGYSFICLFSSQHGKWQLNLRISGRRIYAMWKRSFPWSAHLPENVHPTIYHLDPKICSADWPTSTTDSLTLILKIPRKSYTEENNSQESITSNSNWHLDNTIEASPQLFNGQNILDIAVVFHEIHSGACMVNLPCGQSTSWEGLHVRSSWSQYCPKGHGIYTASIPPRALKKHCTNRVQSYGWLI